MVGHSTDMILSTLASGVCINCHPLKIRSFSDEDFQQLRPLSPKGDSLTTQFTEGHADDCVKYKAGRTAEGPNAILRI